MIDADVRTAISASHLRGLPPELLAAVTAHARRTAIPAGTAIHRPGELEPHLHLVLRGLARVP